MELVEMSNRVDALYAEMGAIKKQIEVIIKIQDQSKEKIEQEKESKITNLTEIREEIRYMKKEMDLRFSSTDTRIIETKQEIMQLSQEMRQGFSEMRNKLDSTLKWVIGICLTSVFGVAAIVIAVLLK